MSAYSGDIFGLNNLEANSSLKFDFVLFRPMLSWPPTLPVGVPEQNGLFSRLMYPWILRFSRLMFPQIPRF